MIDSLLDNDVLIGSQIPVFLQEYDYISSKRNAYFYSSKPQPHQYTILVRGIPVSPGSSVSESVGNFFKEYHSSTYLSHVVIHRTNRLFFLIVSPFAKFKYSSFYCCLHVF